MENSPPTVFLDMYPASYHFISIENRQEIARSSPSTLSVVSVVSLRPVYALSGQFKHLQLNYLRWLIVESRQFFDRLINWLKTATKSPRLCDRFAIFCQRVYDRLKTGIMYFKTAILWPFFGLGTVTFLFGDNIFETRRICWMTFLFGIQISVPCRLQLTTFIDFMVHLVESNYILFRTNCIGYRNIYL